MLQRLAGFNSTSGSPGGSIVSFIKTHFFFSLNGCFKEFSLSSSTKHLQNLICSSPSMLTLVQPSSISVMSCVTFLVSLFHSGTIQINRSINPIITPPYLNTRLFFKGTQQLAAGQLAARTTLRNQYYSGQLVTHTKASIFFKFPLSSSSIFAASCPCGELSSSHLSQTLFEMIPNDYVSYVLF